MKLTWVILLKERYEGAVCGAGMIYSTSDGFLRHHYFIFFTSTRFMTDLHHDTTVHLVSEASRWQFNRKPKYCRCFFHSKWLSFSNPIPGCFCPFSSVWHDYFVTRNVFFWLNFIIMMCLFHERCLRNNWLEAEGAQANRTYEHKTRSSRTAICFSTELCFRFLLSRLRL